MSSSPSLDDPIGEAGAPAPRLGTPGAVARLLLGRDASRQGPIKLTLIAVLVYVLFTLIVAVEVQLGLMARGPAIVWAVISLTGILGFYLLVRTGWSERISADRSLTMLQSLFGVVSTAIGYAVNPPLRGAIIAIMLLNLIWGMFVLRTRQAFALCAFALCLLGATMLWLGVTDPERFPPRIEVIHFAFAVILLVSTSALSTQMGALRKRLTNRKVELQNALDRIRDLAQTDELTSLSNRRHVMELLAAEQLVSRHNGKPLALVLIDIDHFKLVNAQHGHAVGDSVLREFSAVMRSCLRGSDFLGRWGGEEFLLAAPDATTDKAVSMVERMHAELARASFDHIVPGLGITFSAGATECGPSENTYHAIERADRALYRAKANGRNQTQSLPRDTDPLTG
jgi:diguanylate cyclase (GGDEF)-like protein